MCKFYIGTLPLLVGKDRQAPVDQLEGDPIKDKFQALKIKHSKKKNKPKKETVNSEATWLELPDLTNKNAR